MKTFITLFFVYFIVIFSIQSQEQQFLWAQSYEISDCNEVAALAVDSDQNIIIAGVHEGDVFVPYNGDIYINKTDPDGSILWSYNISGDMIMGDMIAMDTDIILVGQAMGPFIYDNIEYGSSAYYLFVLRFDENGDVVWFYEDESKLGTYANLAGGENDKFVLHTRNQSNLGDWIYVMDMAGDTLKSRLISPIVTMVEHITYYNEKVYLTGGLGGFSGVVIDTLYIPQSPLESTAFVLALSENLYAEWVSLDTTFAMGDGHIEANESGIFVYHETLTPPFTIINNLKRFSFSGELLIEVVVPIFSAAIPVSPEMDLSEEKLAMFCKNSFNSESFKVIIYDHDLELIDEKVVTGPSDSYSNQLVTQGDNFIISHVHSGELNMNSELTLPYNGSGLKPYIAKIGELTTQTDQNINEISKVKIFPNPARGTLFISSLDKESHPVKIELLNFNGQVVSQPQVNKFTNQLLVNHIPPGVYVLKCTFINGDVVQEKVILQ